MTASRHNIILFIAASLLTLMMLPVDSIAQRRVTPVVPASPTKAPVDSALIRQRALEARRARSTHYHDDKGNVIMVDTVTGTEWVDSTMLPKKPKMLYPKIYNLSVGVNLWDPIMRAFGQDYGLADLELRLNMYNRYIPTFEFGLGQTKHKPDEYNYTYHSSIAPYAKIGIDYNFLFNSNPDYQLYGGLRYGFSTFKYNITGATTGDTYWGEPVTFDIPSQSATAGWMEIVLGLRVRLFGNISAGWALRYHSILHQSHPTAGDPWYIPGYGTASSPLSGSITISYTIPLNNRKKTPSQQNDIDDLGTPPEGNANGNDTGNMADDGDTSDKTPTAE